MSSHRSLRVALGLVLFGALLQDSAQQFTDYCFFAQDVCPHPNISFYLRKGINEEPIMVTLDNMMSAPFEENLPVVLLIHGYTGNRFDPPNSELVPAYLKRGGYNIVSMDWSAMVRQSCYIQAAYNVDVAGKCAAQFLRRLYEVRGPQWKQRTHVIGFSLGAHVGGVIGRYLPGLPRITGLDAALPLFSPLTSNADSRLDSTDANFVDAYHANAEQKGRVSPVGHIDFYINDGRTQPGCSNSTCSHVRAVEIFAESVTYPTNFYGLPCELGLTSYLIGITDVCSYVQNGSCIEVLAGEFVNPSARGTYRFDTNASPPYGKGSSCASSP